MLRAWRGWREDPVDRFGVLLFFVVATIVVSSVVDVGASYRASLLAHSMSGAALIAAARATGVRRAGRRLVIAAVSVAIGLLALLAIAESVYGPNPLGVAPARGADPVWLALVLVVPVIVLRRVARHTVVGTRTVLGVVSTYLQIGVAYAALFQAIDAWSTTYAFGEQQTSNAYMYVSLTTMSTLGIGDIVPATALARLVLSSEAVLGQVFLVTVVAIVVSRFAGGRGGAPDVG
ncbi:MAG TPA: potassium channel family protein [Ornithinibacter sp.]|nr:potassium channel family protein [Ornithinibacter sp.]